MSARRPRRRRGAPSERAPREAHAGDDPRAARLLAGLALAALVVFAGAVLLVNAGPHRIGGLDAETDFYGGYAPAAAALQHGRVLGPDGRLPRVFGFVGPFYPATLALLGAPGRDLFRTALALSLLSALAILALWGDLLRRRVGPAAGAVVVLLLAANPVLFRQAYWVTTDALAVALQALALWLLLRQHARPLAFAAGLAAAAAFLTRYTSLWLVPAALVALALEGAPRRARAMAAFLAGFLLLALPWAVFARLHGGTVQFHQLLAYDLYGTPQGLTWDDFLARVWPRYEHDPLELLASDPVAIARHLLGNLVGHARADVDSLVGWPVAVLALAGLWLAIVQRSRALGSLVQCGAWSYLALVPAGYNDRYALAVLPAYAALASIALAAPIRPPAVGVPQRREPGRTGRARALALVRAGLVLAVAAWSARGSLRLQRSVLEQQPLEALECSRTLRALARAGEHVIARKPHVGWLAGLETTAYPASDDLSGLAEGARAASARWLYLSVSEALLRPRTAYLLDTTANVPGLTRRATAVVPVRLEGKLDWWRFAVLYEIGPGFGREPEWAGYPALRALHTLRGAAATVPNAALWLRLAASEWALGDTLRARAAWEKVVRLDPPGAAGLLSAAGGDTLRVLATAGR